MSPKRDLHQEDCFIVNTNSFVHQAILDDIDSSAMFSGKITGVGPRYCPSIEDKVHRFNERDSHHLFLEPEWSGSDQLYVNGFSTSLPEETQVKALREIEALKVVELIRPGYAIEYDFFPPRQLKSSLESKNVGGLFFAGQINGTSGYEEASAQGLVAGINAQLYVRGDESLTFSRTNSYIGVMIDDLVTSHLDEPYRMFTSRAEHRLFLRPDNCYTRLSSQSLSCGSLTKKQASIQSDYLSLVEKISNFVALKKTVYKKKKSFIGDIVERPEVSLLDYLNGGVFSKNPFFSMAVFEVETTIKYQGYIVNERERILKNKSLESLSIPKELNYFKISGLSNESKERLSRVLPETLGQASRIFGIRPTDITIIGIYVSSFVVSRET